MKAQNITEGMQARLTAEAAQRYALERYGCSSDILTVAAVEARRGYRVPWIVCQLPDGTRGYFKPSDFKGAAK